MRFGEILSLLIAVLGIVATIGTSIPTGRWGIMVVVTICLVIVGFSIMKVSRNSDKSVPTSALTVIQELSPTVDQITAEGCEQYLKSTVQQTADLVASVSGETTYCCLQIILAGDDPDDAILEDVARDGKSATWTADLKKHGITQFLRLSSSQYHVATTGIPYFNHDVSQDLSFQCPLLALTKYDESLIPALPVVGPYIRRARWPLYRSRAVTAVRCTQEKSIIGFLSITSPSSFAFRRQRDVAMLNLVAAQLNRPLEQWLLLRRGAFKNVAESKHPEGGHSA